MEPGLCDWLKKGHHGICVKVRKVEDVSVDSDWWEERRWSGSTTE